MTININQWLFSKEQQRTLLEQWLTCDEYGMSTLQFCEQYSHDSIALVKAVFC